MDEGACYICFETLGTEPSPCACVTQRVHRGCLIQHARLNGVTACSICKQAFPIQLRTHKRWHVHGRAKCFLILVFVFICLVCTLIARWRVGAYWYGKQVLLEIGVLTAAAVLCCVLCAFESYFYCSGRWQMIIITAQQRTAVWMETGGIEMTVI